MFSKLFILIILLFDFIEAFLFWKINYERQLKQLFKKTTILFISYLSLLKFALRNHSIYLYYILSVKEIEMIVIVNFTDWVISLLICSVKQIFLHYSLQLFFSGLVSLMFLCYSYFLLFFSSQSKVQIQAKNHLEFNQTEYYWNSLVNEYLSCYFLSFIVRFNYSIHYNY